VIQPAPKVGWYRPEAVRSIDVPSPDPALVARLRSISGLSSAASDALGALEFRSAVPASAIAPVGRGPAPVLLIGRVITLRYVPLRRAPGADEPNGRLAYGTAFDLADPGDVLVISAPRDLAVSVLGGNAMAAANAAGLAGAIAEGWVRDVDEIDEVGLPVWAAGVTPVSGRGWLEAVAINGPVEVRGVQVRAGDVAVADASGTVFVPAAEFEALARRLLHD
jgi:regulator of RNase E activity RraA